MTLTEIQAQWARYMHRSDLSVDMAATTQYARRLIAGRMMGSFVSPEVQNAAVDELMVTDPQLWLNAGLIWLAQLAMDNDTLSRSMQRFDSDMADYVINWSINNVDPVMIKG